MGLLIGSPKDSYTTLHTYGEALKVVNEGIVFDMKLEDNTYFKYASMTLGCSIKGLRSCIWLVLLIDVVHLRGKYKGVILIASLVDDNKQTYLFAFRVVDKEFDE